MRPFIFLSFLFFAGLSLQTAARGAAPDDLSKYKTADTLWTHIGELRSSLMETLQNQDAATTDRVLPMRAALTAFIAQYPKDKQIWDARLLLCQLNSMAWKLKVPGTPSPEESTKQLDAIVADKTAPKDARAEGSFQLVMLAFPAKPEDPVNLDALDAKITAFEKEFADFSLDGSSPAYLMMRQEEMMVFKMSGNVVKYQALLKTVAAGPNPDLAEFAQLELKQIQKVAELKTKPFDLKYTAVDGTKVDLAQMRGKVVLIDFWATWCGPCVAEMPEVIAAYKKYHAQGFEIVGVSLDEDKSRLLAFTRQYEMPWPQFFDGKRFDNSISSSFFINSVPTMWLIDKKGMLVNTEAGTDLDGNIEKLLKAP